MRREAFDIIGAPFDLGSAKRGCAAAPGVLRDSRLIGRLNTLEKEVGVSIVDAGDVAAPQVGDEAAIPKFLPEILEFSDALMSRLRRSHEACRTPVVVGGDHSISIPVVSAAAGFLKSRDGEEAELGLIWLDAHADLETPDLKPREDLHAMPAAHLLGYGASELCELGGFRPKVKPENLVYLGLRDVYENERKLIRDTKPIIYTPSDIERLGIVQICERVFSHMAERVSGFALSFDVDVLDPLEAPGVQWPARGGLTYREATVIAEYAARSDGLLSLDFVEYLPSSDRNGATCEALVELIRTALGGTVR